MLICRFYALCDNLQCKKSYKYKKSYSIRSMCPNLKLCTLAIQLTVASLPETWSSPLHPSALTETFHSVGSRWLSESRLQSRRRPRSLFMQTSPSLSPFSFFFFFGSQELMFPFPAERERSSNCESVQRPVQRWRYNDALTSRPVF